MEKKIIFLELPANIIEKMDEQNNAGSRSIFISELLEKQLQTNTGTMQPISEIPSNVESEKRANNPGQISLMNNKGVLLGNFDINTINGFESLAEKICELSNDPAVKLKADRWR